MTSIFSLDKWFEIVERGTSGDQIMDILYSWKSEKEKLDKFVEAVGLLTTLKGDMQINVNDPVGMAQEIERHIRDWQSRAEAAESEVTRLRAALEQVAEIADELDVTGHYETIIRNALKGGEG